MRCQPDIVFSVLLLLLTSKLPASFSLIFNSHSLFRISANLISNYFLFNTLAAKAMAAVSELLPSHGFYPRSVRLSPVASGLSGRKNSARILRHRENFELQISRSFLSISRTTHPKFPLRSCTCMALVGDRVTQPPSVATSKGALAYDLVQGSLVKRNNEIGTSPTDVPTAVLLHGILGSRKNWGSFSKRLAQEFPLWQFLLVDLRCHGDSSSIKKQGPHTVASAALDVLKLVGQLRLTPRVLVGHSFGGKVALSMVDQAAKPLARPVRVWVLDSTPGKVRPGGDGEDHPGELIEYLSKLPKKISSKQEVVSALVQEGFSMAVARWVVTNLRPNGSASTPGFSWGFDLKGITEMFKSYEGTNLWKIVENVPRGVHVNFLKAERSLHRWAVEDIERIHAAEELASDEGAGVEMHLLEDAGHWVHADNPDGLFKILSKSFRFRPQL